MDNQKIIEAIKRLVNEINLLREHNLKLEYRISKLESREFSEDMSFVNDVLTIKGDVSEIKEVMTLAEYFTECYIKDLTILTKNPSSYKKKFTLKRITNKFSKEIKSQIINDNKILADNLWKHISTSLNENDQKIFKYVDGEYKRYLELKGGCSPFHDS